VSKRLTLDEAFTPTTSSLLEETKPHVRDYEEGNKATKQVSNQVSNQAIKQSIGIARKEITIRLQQENWDRLERAAMSRKLARTEPYSKQDIMEAALVDWLERNGG
jgi:hypothetical protein